LLDERVDAHRIARAARVCAQNHAAGPQLKPAVQYASARVGDEVMGSLAVLGPPRMDYQHTITAVSYIARLFDKILNEKE